MKNSTLILAVLAAAAIAALAACDLLNNLNPAFGDEDLGPLGENQFYAQDIVTGRYYILTAEMLHEGQTCFVWAEEGSGITKEQAEEIAGKYDEVIRPVTVNRFGMKNFQSISVDKHFDDILDYADWLADGDEKLTILLLDIQDGYAPLTSESYVAGYFFSGNFLEKGKFHSGLGNRTTHYSNGRDMMYIDTHPGLEEKRVEQTYATFAHELQHLINYATFRWLGRWYMMDTWVDEGLSSQAEYFYLGENPADKCQWFNLDPKGTIARGNNFFVWGNHHAEAVLDDYATVYLFFRWLYLQADQDMQQDIFEKIITSEYHSFRAVTEMAKKIDSSWDDWGTLLKTWLAANHDPSNAVYGYKGDEYLQNGRRNTGFQGIRVRPIGGSTALLYPGEGVYSLIDSPSFTLPSGGETGIRYANYNSATGGNVLLTYNTDTNIYGGGIPGQLTGVSPPVARTLAGDSQAGRFTGPYVMDARDLLGRNLGIPMYDAVPKERRLKAEK